MNAATPNQPAPTSDKAREVKTDHIRRGATVFGIFVAAVALALVIHGIVAPHRTKVPGGIAGKAQNTPPPQVTVETPASLAKEIGAYRQAAAAAQGVVYDQAAAGGAPPAAGGAAGVGAGGAPETPSQRRMSQEEAEYIRQQLRQPMQLYSSAPGLMSAPSPAPAQPNTLATGDVQARYQRINEQLADLARRQHAGQN